MNKIYNLTIIRELCRKKNISQRELAEKINMTKSGVQNIIKQNSTTPRTLQKIADALGVSPNVFLAEETSNTFYTTEETQENYSYKDKYIHLLEEYNKLLKEKLDMKECHHKTSNPDA